MPYKTYQRNAIYNVHTPHLVISFEFFVEMFIAAKGFSPAILQYHQ